MTIYTQVAGNRSKTIFYLFLFSMITLAIGWIASWFFNSPVILVFAAVLTIGQGIAGYWFSDSIALAAAQAVPMDERQYGSVYKLVQNLTITAGLPMPQLYLINDSAMNAFATGRDAEHAAIAMTSGLINRLNENELAGVLAHELSHVGNEDIRLMSLVMIMGGLITLISDWMLRSMWWGGGRRRDNDANGVFMLIAIVLAILAPIAATLIQLAISRKREFMADANAVLLTRYPEGLVSALRKISGDEEPLEVANKATAHMYFANPLHGKVWLASLFSTHPPIEERIAAIEAGSGLRS